MQEAISQKLDTHKTDTRTIYRWRSAIGRWRKSVDSARHHHEYRRSNQTV